MHKLSRYDTTACKHCEAPEQTGPPFQCPHHQHELIRGAKRWPGRTALGKGGGRAEPVGQCGGYLLLRASGTKGTTENQAEDNIYYITILLCTAWVDRFNCPPLNPVEILGARHTPLPPTRETHDFDFKKIWKSFWKKLRLSSTNRHLPIAPKVYLHKYSSIANWSSSMGDLRIQC